MTATDCYRWPSLIYAHMDLLLGFAGASRNAGTEVARLSRCVERVNRFQSPPRRLHPRHSWVSAGSQGLGTHPERSHSLGGDVLCGRKDVRARVDGL